MSGFGRVYNNAMVSLEARATELAMLQEQAATGRRVIRASDDPGGAYRILGLREQERTTEAYKENLHTVEMGLENASSALEQVSTNLIRANQLLTQATSDIYSDENRAAMAMEIDGLLEHCLSLANTSIMDKFLFGGAQVTTAPFEAVRDEGRIVGAEYQGSHNELLLPVAPGVTYYGTLVGDTVFQLSERERPEFYGNTGALPGSGTSSVQGHRWLVFSHTTTTYGGGIGMAAGASSADGDTILGNGHTLTVDADTNSVWLDNGEAKSYSALTTDMMLTNEDGDVVYVDTSGVTLGAGQQTISIDAHGQATIDDGLSYTTIDTFADNIMVTDAATGRVIYVNTTSLDRVGAEAACMSGTYDLFETLALTRDLMLGESDLSEEDRSELLVNAANSLDEVMAGVTENMTAVGSRLQALDMLEEGLGNLEANVTLEASYIGDADITEVAIDLVKAQTFYQMTLVSVSKMLSLSLMDYL